MQDTSSQHAYGFLTRPEVQFLDAAVERLIPTDELGPGARDAGVTAYIDGQLTSTWGMHGRNYRSGPWADGTPQQGFQSRLTPQEIYRYGIRETNLHCRVKYEKNFEFLSAGQRDDVLRALARITDRSAIRYRLVGEGPLQGPLEQLVQRLDLQSCVEITRFLPHEEVRALLRDTDIFILTSRTASNGDQEGVPVSLIEAQMGAAGAIVLDSKTVTSRRFYEYVIS